MTVSNVLSSGEWQSGACGFPGRFIIISVDRSDLNSSVMTGSSRVVDHTTFSELQWRRDLFSLNFFTLPPGFQVHSHALGEEFVEVLKDISALQCIRDSALFGHEDVISMAHIDNHQASIQSRLVTLQRCSSLSECCHLAAYLCSTMLRCRIWRTSTVPVCRSRRLYICIFYHMFLHWLDIIVSPFITAPLQATTDQRWFHMGLLSWSASLAPLHWGSFCPGGSYTIRLHSTVASQPRRQN